MLDMGFEDWSTKDEENEEDEQGIATIESENSIAGTKSMQLLYVIEEAR